MREGPRGETRKLEVVGEGEVCFFSSSSFFNKYPSYHPNVIES